MRPLARSLLIAAFLFAFVAGSAYAPTASAAPPADKGAKKVKPLTNVIPIKIGDIFVRDGQLFATVKIDKNKIEVPIKLSTSPGDDCPILHLALGPIHLDVLGLVVDTSPICLAIDADPGAGNLLGNLLCGVSHLLDAGGLDLVLATLTADELSAVLDGLTDLLNGALGVATAPAALAGVSGNAADPCDILNLSVGPVNLDLLGLVVNLDDCSGGPVTVDITAVPGALLGDLLCDLAGLLDGDPTAAQVDALLRQIAGAILDLL